MTDFRAKLQSLVSLEMSAARRKNHEAMADMIEALAASLGLTIAIMARGDAKHAQELMTGIEAYLYETVTQHSPLARLMPEARSGSQ